MKLQNLLKDVVQYTDFDKIDVLKVTPEEDGVKVQTFDESCSLFVIAKTFDAFPEITGEFGLFNFKILKGLLSLPNFQTDDAVFKIGSRVIDGQNYPDRIEFKGGGTKATFRLMNKEVVPGQPTIVNIPWDITLTPSPSKVAEFKQMASLYRDVENLFSLTTTGSELVANFGADTASTHSASLVMEDTNGSLTGDLKFPIDKFLAVMKVAQSAKAYEIKITNNGILGVVAVTEHATYNYYIKASV